MVAEQVPLQATGQISHLDGQAVDPALFQPVPGKSPLDPVDDAERRRIGLPTVPDTGRVVADPALYQSTMPTPLLIRCIRVEDVEVVQVI